MRPYKISTQKRLLIFSAIFWGWISAAAEPIPGTFPPKVSLQLISPTGAVLNNPSWPTQAQWTLAPARESVPFKNPIVRSWIQLPVGTVLSPKYTNKVPGQVTRNPKDSPFSSSKNEVLAIETESVFTSLPLQTKPSAPGAKPQEVNLVVSLVSDKPTLWLDPACEDQEISANKQKDNGKFLYVAVSCKPKPDTIEIYVSHSPDGELFKISGLGQKEKEGNFWELYTVKKPKEGVVAQKHVIGTVLASEKGNNKDFSSVVFEFQPRKKGSRFNFSAGAAATYQIYTESADTGVTNGSTSIKLTEIALTGKFNAVFALVPRVLDIGANAFMTLLPVTKTISATNFTTDSAARFYGINARIGYRLPVGTGAVDWSFLTGWYFWGMLVPDSSYGLTLSGPQVFVTTRVQQAGHRSYFVYVKFAPLSNSTSIKLENREFAFGGGYQLSNPQAKRTWTLTLDLADARFSCSAAGDTSCTNAMNLQSASLGIQMGL